MFNRTVLIHANHKEKVSQRKTRNTCHVKLRSVHVMRIQCSVMKTNVIIDTWHAHYWKKCLNTLNRRKTYGLLTNFHTLLSSFGMQHKEKGEMKKKGKEKLKLIIIIIIINTAWYNKLKTPRIIIITLIYLKNYPFQEKQPN